MDSMGVTTLFVGFVLGMEHALDADHVVAVSTIVSHSRSLWRSSLTGIFWGVGHSLTLVMVGLVVLLFKVHIPERWALSMEFFVGLVLVALGGQILWQYRRKRVHAHVHSHGGEVHIHFHSHALGEDHDHDHHASHLRKPLLVGMIHGLAGSAALMLLVLTTVRSAAQGFLYILVFGVGSIVGMLLTSSLIALPFALTAARFQRINEAIRIVAGVVSIILGAAIMIEIGFLKGLFASL
ncbi:MAG: sulfite exporter TauE/SafE family protein [Candidatus Methylomirabilales bacterium]